MQNKLKAQASKMRGAAGVAGAAAAFKQAGENKRPAIAASNDLEI